MREATEGFYSDRNMFAGTGEFMPTPDVALSVRKITAHACERIARAGFELAMKRDKHVTAVHKANNFNLTDGLFMTAGPQGRTRSSRRCASTTSSSTPWPRISCADPSRFDVIVTTNFYADILSDLASELSGSLGLAGSINANAELGLVCAQAQHGSAPDIQNQNIANPTSLILSVAMMLTWLGEQRGLPNFEAAGAEIERAVDEVLANPQTRTRDLGGTIEYRCVRIGRCQGNRSDDCTSEAARA